MSDFLDVLVHPKTGTYWNPSKDRWEAWAVNSRTGEATMLGWLAKEAEAGRGDWEREIWEQLLPPKGERDVDDVIEVYEVEVVNATTNLWLPEEWQAMTEDVRLWVDNDGPEGTEVLFTRRTVSRAEFERQRIERDGRPQPTG